jgi:large subunit ribosomal protein L29
MKTTELRGKTADQLNELLGELKREALNLRFQKVTGELEKTSRIREVRRTVAKIKTLLNEVARKQEKKHA